LVSYVPAKRCILRYDQLDHAQPESFYGKVYAHDDAARLFAQMQALWDYSQRRAPELVLARPLGCDPKSNALWQSSPGGEALLEVMDPETLPDIMRRVAAALAALHRADVEPERIWSVQDETVKLERARAALGRFYPTLVPQIDTVLGALVHSAPPEAARRVPVHGDFHCNQVLVRDDRVAIIDFDLCGRGDPLHDVARFLSRFRAYARGRLSADVFDRAQESFLSTYEILVPWTVDRRRLAWWMAVLLVNRQALKAVKKLSTGAAEPLAEMLAMAAAMARDEELR
jgi:aminoglycoside phosphotransferase (APT) family kinase protein